MRANDWSTFGWPLARCQPQSWWRRPLGGSEVGGKIGQIYARPREATALTSYRSYTAWNFSWFCAQGLHLHNDWVFLTQMLMILLHAVSINNTQPHWKSHHNTHLNNFIRRYNPAISCQANVTNIISSYVTWRARAPLFYTFWLGLVGEFIKYGLVISYLNLMVRNHDNSCM